MELWSTSWKEYKNVALDLLSYTVKINEKKIKMEIFFSYGDFERTFLKVLKTSRRFSEAFSSDENTEINFYHLDYQFCIV